MRHVFDGAKLFISNTRCRLRSTRRSNFTRTPDQSVREVRTPGRRRDAWRHATSARTFKINDYFAPSKTWRIKPWKGLLTEHHRKKTITGYIDTISIALSYTLYNLSLPFSFWHQPNILWTLQIIAETVPLTNEMSWPGNDRWWWWWWCSGCDVISMLDSLPPGAASRVVVS